MAILQLTEANSGQVVDLALGQVLELRLPENATTGFRWQVRSEPGPGCTIQQDTTESPPGPPIAGEGGTHVWRLEGVQVGTCQFSLAYVRPWETGRAPASTFELRINVKRE